MSDQSHPSFRFLHAIAADLARGNVTFPTFAQATLRVRTALDDPAIDLERLAQVITTEPMLAARIVQMANAAAVSPGGKPVSDVRNAILRIGRTPVKAVATAIAMEQLRGEFHVPDHQRFAEATWRHSVQVAAVASVLARRMSRLNPDEALFAGLVHDIGHFYLLSQVHKYPELEQRPEELQQVLAEWHPGIGQAVLFDFRLPDAALLAVAEHETGHYRLPLRSLQDVVALANLVCAQTNPVPGFRAALENRPLDADVVAQVNDARDEIRALAAALRG